MKKNLIPILISIIFLSCQKENYESPLIPEINSSIKLENELLKINSLDNFNSLIKDAYTHHSDQNYLLTSLKKNFLTNLFLFK